MDHRDRAAIAGKWYAKFDDERMVAIVEHTNDEGEEVEVAVHCVFGVCGTCNGRGKHVNSSIDAHGITPEEFAEDPDFRQSYFRGDYDVPCNECGGQRVVPEPDERRLTAEAREALEYGRQCQRERIEDARTMRMENGGY
jgi:hypothetical protein